MDRMMRLWLTAAGLIAATIHSAPPALASPAPAKPAVVRGNEWHLRNSLSTGIADISFSYGSDGDFPLMGDWDGNGSATPGVVRGNTWHLRNSNSTGIGEISFQYGSVGDIPFVGDWDGDGRDTPGVVRGGGGCGPFDCVFFPTEWHLRNENSTGNGHISFVAPHAVGPVFPTIGDWDKDGDDNPGWRPILHSNEWFMDTGLDGTAETQFLYGTRTDFPIAGDWDGDVMDSAGIVRGNVWHLRNELTTGDGETSFAYGKAGDIFLVWH